MTEDAAHALDGNAFGQRERGETVARDVKRDVALDAAPNGNLAQAYVAVAAARYRENRAVKQRWSVFLDYAQRNIQQLNINRDLRLGTEGRHPLRTVREGDDLVCRQILNVNVGEARERRKDEQVAHDIQLSIIQSAVYHPTEFILGQITALLDLRTDAVVSERIGGDRTVVVRSSNDHLQRDAVQPSRGR